MYDPIGSVLGAWSAGDGLWAIAFRLALALTFGAVLGCERAAKRHGVVCVFYLDDRNQTGQRQFFKNIHCEFLPVFTDTSHSYYTPVGRGFQRLARYLSKAPPHNSAARRAMFFCHLRHANFSIYLQ